MLAAARRLVAPGFASLPPPVHASLPPPAQTQVDAHTTTEYCRPRASSAAPTVHIPELVARLLANRSTACAASADAADNTGAPTVPIAPPTVEQLCILHDVPTTECRHLHAQRMAPAAELSPPCAELMPSKMSSPPTTSPLWSWHELDNSIPHTQPAPTTLDANLSEAASFSLLPSPPSPVDISHDGHASIDPDVGIEGAWIKGAAIKRSCIEPSSPHRHDSLHCSPLSTFASEPLDCETGVTPVGSARAMVLISRELSESLPEAMTVGCEIIDGLTLAAPKNSIVQPAPVLVGSIGFPLSAVAPQHVVERHDKNTSACPHVVSRIPRAAPRPHSVAVGNQRLAPAHAQGVSSGGGVFVTSNAATSKRVSVVPPQLPPPTMSDVRARAAKQKELRVRLSTSPRPIDVAHKHRK